MMEMRVQKWGNSLAVRIPKALAVQAGLRENLSIEMTLADGALSIKPVPGRSPSLEELLAHVTDDNLHGEWDTGRPVGNEVW